MEVRRSMGTAAAALTSRTPLGRRLPVLALPVLLALGFRPAWAQVSPPAATSTNAGKAARCSASTLTAISMRESPPTTILDTLEGSSVGKAHGIKWVEAVGRHGATFVAQSASRIEYPRGIPGMGTIEFWIKVNDGYTYNNYNFVPDRPSAMIFSTDVQGGDVTWPGTTKFSVAANGDLTFWMATSKYNRPPSPPLKATATSFRFHEWHALGISYGSEGQYIMLDGRVVASAPSWHQTLGRAGNHQQPLDLPTLGETVSHFWPANRYSGGFEGIVALFRASSRQRDWLLACGISGPGTGGPAAPPPATADAEKLQTYFETESRAVTEMPPPKMELRELLALKGTGALDDYQHLYLLAVNRRDLAGDALAAMGGFLKSGDLEAARKYAVLYSKHYQESNTLFNAAEQTYSGGVALAGETLDRIYRTATLMEEAGVALTCGVTCAQLVDVVVLEADVAVDTHLKGREDAEKAFIAKALVHTIMQAGLGAWIGNQAVTLVSRSGLTEKVVDLAGSPEVANTLNEALWKTGAWGTQKAASEAASGLLKSLIDAAQHAWASGP